jgi:hypothetical protein
LFEIRKVNSMAISMAMTMANSIAMAIKISILDYAVEN